MASISVHLKSIDRHEIAAQLSYILAHFAIRYEFMSQARDLAALIQQHSYRCQSRDIAAFVAAGLNEHPAWQVTWPLSTASTSARTMHIFYISTVLLGSSIPFKERLATISRFFVDALQSHATEAPERQAAIHYSFGNTLRVSGAMLAALQQYNFARRKNPDYLRRGYFLAELAAALFYSGHYRMAATLYDRSYDADPKMQVAICAGDAHLFSGHLVEAQRCYDAATSSHDVFERCAATTQGLAGSVV